MEISKIQLDKPICLDLTDSGKGRFHNWYEKKKKNLSLKELGDTVNSWTWNLGNLFEIFGPEIFKNPNKFLKNGSVSQKIESI